MRLVRLAVATAGAIGLAAAAAHAQQYPMLDKLAEKVVQKYQMSSCQQLAMQRAQNAGGGGQRGQMEERVVMMMRQDPGMRREFIGRVAAPIANKMFECGLIP